jgi:hypothetical protein
VAFTQDDAITRSLAANSNFYFLNIKT